MGTISCVQFEQIFNEHYRKMVNQPDLPFFSPFVSSEEVYTGPNDKVFPEIKELLPELKRLGYTIGLVTNNYYLDEDKQHSALYIQSIHKYFDQITESCRAGCSKPGEGIFKLTLAKMGKNASECVFLDDSQNNLVNADALGIQTIWVDELSSAMSKLAEILDEPTLEKRRTRNRRITVEK